MDVESRCAICHEQSERLALRALVPAAFLTEGVFDLDPLGTDGAQVTLCPDCLRVLSAPMLLAEDTETFAKAVALHQDTHAPSGAGESVAARVRLWHRALHLGLRALATELEATPVVAPARVEPDQLGLFTSRTARLAKVEAALAEGDLPLAAERAADLAQRFELPEVSYLAKQIPALVKKLEKLALDPEKLAEAVDRKGNLFDPSKVPESLAAAIVRHLHRSVAEAAEQQKLLVVRGQLVGRHWQLAGQIAQAQTALEAAAAKGVMHGQALAMLGDLSFRQGHLQAAREHYRTAFCEDPAGVAVETIADPAIQTLLDDAKELELAPPEAWVPMAGWASSVFALPPEAQGQGECREFHAALLEGRRGGGVEARRRMKRLAPLLFERLRDGGKL